MTERPDRDREKAKFVYFARGLHSGLIKIGCSHERIFMAERGYITPNGIIVLRYLNERMEATSRSVGLAVLPPRPGEMPNAQIASVGRSIAMHLRYQGLVTFLPDLRAWRITQAGRDALAAI